MMVILLHLLIQAVPEIIITIINIRKSRRPETFTNYSVLRHFMYSCHELSAVCAAALYCLQLSIVEDGIQYIGGVQFSETISGN
jgi:hypothetical protein